MNKILKNTLILTVITLVAGLGLGLVYEVTKAPIAQAQETAKKEAWQQVFPEADLNDFEQIDVDQDAADKAIADMGDLFHIIYADSRRSRIVWITDDYKIDFFC